MKWPVFAALTVACGSLPASPRPASPITAIDHSDFDNFACWIVDAEVYCWGVGEHGELGDGVKSSAWRGPVRVVGVRDAVAIVAGFEDACALQRGGTVVCWGSLTALAVGQVTADPWPTPAALEGASVLAECETQTCAVVTGGVVCWGGRITDATGRSRSTFGVTPVPGTTGAIDVRRRRQFEMCASFRDGPDRCWFTTPAPPSYVR